LKLLKDGLRFWTGLSEINFEMSGNLDLGNRSHLSGGSTLARELIIAAVDSQDSFELERQDNCSTIAFAQIESTLRYIDAQGARHSVWRLRLDFSDFTELVGTKETRTAFDPAINLVHELTHAVRGYFDPVDESDELGECERYINKMRLELGLPQRVHYYPHYKSVAKNDGSSFTQGEIRFVDSNVDTGEQRKFLMTFNLEKVFDRSKAKPKSAVEASLLAQKRRQDKH
jgi:hypothetical protein